MFSYSTPELMDAEVRYRRERITRDWQALHGDPISGSLAHRAFSAIAAVAHVRTSPRHHRPA